MIIVIDLGNNKRTAPIRREKKKYSHLTKRHEEKKRRKKWDEDDLATRGEKENIAQ